MQIDFVTVVHKLQVQWFESQLFLIAFRETQNLKLIFCVTIVTLDKSLSQMTKCKCLSDVDIRLSSSRFFASVSLNSVSLLSCIA